jgi:hypothetical protein
MWHCFDFGRPVKYPAVFVDVQPFSLGESREMTNSAALRNKWWNAGRKLLARALSHAAAWSLSVSTAMVRPGLLVALLLVLAPVCLLLTQSGLHASGNTITVNNLTDPASTSGNGFCTLREAINNANAASDTSGGDCAAGTGTDTIRFSVSGTITLTGLAAPGSGQLPAIANSSPGSLTIDGTGQSITVDGANGIDGILVVNPGATLNLNLLTIAHGKAASAQIDGGGIYNGGTLTVTNSTFSSNSAPSRDGGGIFNIQGTLTVINSNFSSNSAGVDGGGIGNSGGTMTVTNSTFSSNSASEGGGINNGDGQFLDSTATISNSTFFMNSAGNGGGIENLSNGTGIAMMMVTNSTFSSNSASNHGGGIETNSPTVTVTNVILANSTSGRNCGEAVTNGGYNISDDNSCGFGSSTAANGDTIGDNVSEPTNVGLDPGGLANNGGPTETIQLKLGSYAIDAVPLAHQCPATDQRGDPRPEPGDNSGACDIGAVESTLEGVEKLVVNPSIPSKLNFGTVSVGTTSTSQTATITSEFNDDTVTFFATFLLANFVQTGSTCGASLGPLQSCQVSFACKPKTTGSIIGAYAFLYSSVEASGIVDGDDYLKIGVVQFTCTGGSIAAAQR